MRFFHSFSYLTAGVVAGGLAWTFAVADATAQTAEPAVTDSAGSVDFATFATIGGLLFVAACLAVGCLNLWQRWQDDRGRLQQTAADATRESARLRRLFGTLPLSGFLWNADGELLFARLPINYGGAVAPDASAHNGDGLGDLAPLLATQDFQDLQAALERMRGDGGPFEMMLRGSSDGGHYRARGAPVAADDGGGHALWLEDVSSTVQGTETLSRQLTATETQLRQLDRLLNHLPLPLYERDADLNIVWCNHAYAAVVGVSREAIIGGETAEIETAMTRSAGKKLAAKAIETKRLQRETRHFVFEGQRRALEVHEVPSLPKRHLVGFVRDVTDLEERESEMRRHIDAHSEVLNNLSTAISIFGADKRLSFYNQAFADLWQFDEEWLSAQPSHNEILDRLRDRRMLPEVTDFPAYKADAMRHYTNLLQTEEEVMYLPDGRVLRQVISPHPFGGLLYFDEDITDALVLERSVNTLTAVQRETINNLYEGVAVYGGDGRLKLFNPAFARIWHLDPELLNEEPHIAAIVDMTRSLFPSGNDWDPLRDKLISQATSRDDISGRMERPDNNVIDYAGVALPDGNMLFTYVDVTDSVNVERALRDRNQALEAADQLKSEFLASVSYELRTPLNVIIGFAEVLVNQYFGELNERQLDYGHDILTSSQQLLALINDILDLASIEAGRLELELYSFGVRELLETVVSLGREGAQSRRMRLEIDCPDDVGAIEADEKRIKQAMYNLVSNSLKFTAAGGTVTIGARAHGDDVELFVEDNGAGISEEDQEIIFDAFRRGRSGSLEHSAGLGLSLVKRFVELHHGRVELESNLGEGTRVAIILPRRQTPDEDSFPAALASAQVH